MVEIKVIDYLKRLFSKPRSDESTTPVKLLHSALLSHGVEASIHDQQIVLVDGIRLTVQQRDTLTLPNGSVRTASCVTATHDTLFPSGLLEYQYSNGSNEAEALASGFDNWVQVDLVPLRDALIDSPVHCTYLEKTFPEGEGQEAYSRQVLFGPTLEYPSAPESSEDDHTFCPCCLFTNSIAAFDLHFRSRELFGVRLFAARNADGSFAADCRINGEEFPDAVPHLIEYAKTWTGAGLEFRKQYVVIRNKP